MCKIIHCLTPKKKTIIKTLVVSTDISISLTLSMSISISLRVSLFLSKMRTFARSGPVMACYNEEDTEEIITRAHELINLLKLPNVAQFVLAPSAGGDGPRWHRDTNASLPQAMRAVSGLLHRHSSFLPT